MDPSGSDAVWTSAASTAAAAPPSVSDEQPLTEQFDTFSGANAPQLKFSAASPGNDISDFHPSVEKKTADLIRS